MLGIDVTLLRESRDARSSGELRHLRSRVAQVLQGLHLVGRLSVLDNVLIGGAARTTSVAPGAPLAGV